MTSKLVTASLRKTSLENEVLIVPRRKAYSVRNIVAVEVGYADRLEKPSSVLSSVIGWAPVPVIIGIVIGIEVAHHSQFGLNGSLAYVSTALAFIVPIAVLLLIAFLVRWVVRGATTVTGLRPYGLAVRDVDGKYVHLTARAWAEVRDRTNDLLCQLGRSERIPDDYTHMRIRLIGGPGI